MLLPVLYGSSEGQLYKASASTIPLLSKRLFAVCLITLEKWKILIVERYEVFTHLWEVKLIYDGDLFSRLLVQMYFTISCAGWIQALIFWNGLFLFYYKISFKKRTCHQIRKLEFSKQGKNLLSSRKPLKILFITVIMIAQFSRKICHSFIRNQTVRCNCRGELMLQPVFWSIGQILC